MLPCNYAYLPLLEPLLVLPPPSVAVAATLLTSAIVVVIDAIVVVHRMPILPYPPIVSSCIDEEGLEGRHSSDSGYCRSRRGQCS